METSKTILEKIDKIQDTNKENECFILQVKYDKNCLHNYCVIYRSPPLKLSNFEPKLGSVSHFLKFSKEESLNF